MTRNLSRYRATNRYKYKFLIRTSYGYILLATALLLLTSGLLALSSRRFLTGLIIGTLIARNNQFSGQGQYPNFPMYHPMQHQAQYHGPMPQPASPPAAATSNNQPLLIIIPTASSGKGGSSPKAQPVYSVSGSGSGGVRSASPIYNGAESSGGAGSSSTSTSSSNGSKDLSSASSSYYDRSSRRHSTIDDMHIRRASALNSPRLLMMAQRSLLNRLLDPRIMQHQLLMHRADRSIPPINWFDSIDYHPITLQPRPYSYSGPHQLIANRGLGIKHDRKMLEEPRSTYNRLGTRPMTITHNQLFA